jgi:transposase InsO family protein
MDVVKKCQPCQFFHPKTHSHPAPLHLVFFIDPFAKWGINFMQCNLTFVRHGFIIVVVDYFIKWVKDIPTFIDDRITIVLFIFNHIITILRVPQAIVIHHGSHIQNHMMVELSVKLSFLHENSSPYYPQANGKIEAINNILKTMI